MYSILRFYHSERERLVSVGTELNRIRPGSYSGLNSSEDQFVVVISSSERWSEHQAAASNILSMTEAALRAGVAAGVEMAIDVAIEPNDLRGRNVFRFVTAQEFLRDWGALQIDFIVSIYCANQSLKSDDADL